MERIKLSETLEVSRIIHGHWRLTNWNLTNNELLYFVENVRNLGITTIDTADIYGNYSCEKLFGDALSLNPSFRKEIEIVTKCGIKMMSSKFPERKVGHYDTSKEHIIHSVNNSLRNLRTDYLDLLLIHRPDPFMDPFEVAEAFHLLHKQGKVLNFGVSNFKPSQFNMLQKFVKLPLVTNQIEISLMNLEHFDQGTIELCQEYEIPPMAWSPLGGGSIFKSNDEKSMRISNKLIQIANRHNVENIDEIMYSWLLAHPSNILPIVGSGNLNHIKRAIKSLNVKISREEWFELLKAARNKDVD